MSSTSFVCQTPMISRGQSASLTPPSPPSKKYCLRSDADFAFAPCADICLPLLDHFDDSEQDNDPFFPTLRPRPTFSFNFHQLSVNDENEAPFDFKLKKQSASAVALAPLPLQPSGHKRKLSLHALCA